MNTLVIVLLSILAWQLVVAIVCFASDENETITIHTAIGYLARYCAFALHFFHQHKMNNRNLPLREISITYQ